MTLRTPRGRPLRLLSSAAGWCLVLYAAGVSAQTTDGEAGDPPPDADSVEAESPGSEGESGGSEPSPGREADADVEEPVLEEEASVGETGAESTSGLRPPELIEFVQAELPPEAVPTTSTAVLYELTVTEAGNAVDLVVLESAGEPFDSAARGAVERFRFVPAAQDGEPVAARIRYRYVFEPEPEPEPEPVLGALTVRLRGDGEAPIARFRALLLEGDRQVAEVETERGEASFADLAGGTYRVLVFADGYQEVANSETVVAGEETLATYRPTQIQVAGDAPDDEPLYGATAVVDPPPREVTRRTIRREELTRVAGTRGDALRAIELLPGVGRPPAGAGVLLVRGSSPQDSQTYLEGNPVPLLYHFGGLTGFVNSRLLDRIDFYPGNFSVRYGRSTGGVVDIGTRDPVTDSFHGVVDINVIDASVLLEAPLGDEVSFAVGARRSYIDAFFGLIPLGDDVNAIAAPVYWDYQAMVTYKPNPNDRFRFRAYGSSDRLRLLFSEPVDGEPGLRGNLDVVTSFHRLEADWTHRYSDDVEHLISVSSGPTHIEFEIGENANFNNDQIETQLRSEWRFRLAEEFQVRAGLDWYLSDFDIQYTGLNPGQSEGAPASGPGGLQSGSSQDTVFVNADILYNYPAAYLEIDYRPVDWLRFVPGIRVDHFSVVNRWTVDPRIATIASLTDDTRVKAGVGLFTQPPEPNETSDAIGNPNLDVFRAVHVSAGVEQDLAPGIRIGLEGFYKHLYDRVVQTADGLAPTFLNDGIGTIYGLELSGRIEARDRPFFGFLSYTFSRSERNDRNEGTRLFDFDQTHVLNMALGYRLGDGWEVSGTFRLATGNPATPVQRGIYDAANDVYVPVLGRQNSVRDSYFHRLDLRVEKQWKFDAWSFALYLDVQNAYNRQNQEGLQFNYDFTDVETVSGLPIIPSLGARGEF